MSSLQSAPLQHAAVLWDDQGLPRCARSGDVFFSSEAGETLHVFLRGNDLSARCVGAGTFCVAETGFGSGLNFAILWQHWQQTAQPTDQLIFRSVEQAPWAPQDLLRVAPLWGLAAPEQQRLLDVLGTLHAGQNTIQITPQISLQIYIGDVCDWLGQEQLGQEQLGPEQPEEVDAWFLDGFSPAVGPGMWTPQVFTGIFAWSRSGGTLATFTAAGAVRRGLIAAGFVMKRAPGFGRKRHMLVGHKP